MSAPGRARGPAAPRGRVGARAARGASGARERRVRRSALVLAIVVSVGGHGAGTVAEAAPADRHFACMQRDLHGSRAETSGDRGQTAAIVTAQWPSIQTTTVPGNGLPVHRIALPGTRALTVLVAFDAGARTERLEENGMAHFLEHLVFKGGEKYADLQGRQRDRRAAGGRAERLHQPRPRGLPHHRARGVRARRRSTCSRDFVGRPRIDAEELDRERGVVIQEINRAYDQPSTVAEYLIDKAAFGEHPLGRTVLGPEENLRSFTREAIVAFRERRWAGARGGAFLVGNIDHLPEEAGAAASASDASPRCPRPSPTCPRPSSRRRRSWSSATPTSRTCA